MGMEMEIEIRTMYITSTHPSKLIDVRMVSQLISMLSKLVTPKFGLYPESAQNCVSEHLRPKSLLEQRRMNSACLPVSMSKHRWRKAPPKNCIPMMPNTNRRKANNRTTLKRCGNDVMRDWTIIRIPIDSQLRIMLSIWR